MKEGICVKKFYTKDEINKMIYSINDAWYDSIGYTDEQIEFIFSYYNVMKGKNKYNVDIRKWFDYIPFNRYLSRFIEMDKYDNKVLNLSGINFSEGLDVDSIINSYCSEHGEDSHIFEDILALDLRSAAIVKELKTSGGLIVLVGTRLISEKAFNINFGDKYTKILLYNTKVKSGCLNFNGNIDNLEIVNKGLCGELNITYNGEEKSLKKHL